MLKDSYTRYPRPLLWLVRGGNLVLAGPDGGRQVAIGSFYISKLPVTNIQFEAFAPDHVRSALSPEDEGPATGISFARAAAYCRWYADVSRKAMRLPTELEWEFACRGGGAAGQGNMDAAAVAEQVWHAGNSGPLAPDARRKPPDRCGLHGMLGTVWEWTTPASASGGGAATAAGKEADREPGVQRGGSFRTGCEILTCSLRRPGRPGQDLGDVGFRVARSFA